MSKPRDIYVMLHEGQMLEDAGDCYVWEVIGLLVRTGLAKSRSEGRRLIEGGGAKVDGEKIPFVNAYLQPGAYVLSRGKRQYARVRLLVAEKED